MILGGVSNQRITKKNNNKKEKKKEPRPRQETREES
jgi:hypothetical protein